MWSDGSSISSSLIAVRVQHLALKARCLIIPYLSCISVVAFAFSFPKSSSRGNFYEEKNVKKLTRNIAEKRKERERTRERFVVERGGAFVVHSRSSVFVA